jgi:hypothetical protein
MKKAITILIVLTISINSLGQFIGLKSGMNFNSITFVENPSILAGAHIESNSTIGYHSGFSFGFNLNDRFSISTGAAYVQKGGNIELTLIDTSVWSGEIYKDHLDWNSSNSYLQIPLRFDAGFFIDDFKIYGIFGGSMDIGLLTKEEYIYSAYTKQNDDYILDFSTTEEERKVYDIEVYKRISFGIIPGIGVEWKNIFLESTFDIGLTNYVIEDQGFTSLKNKSLFLSVGYKFGSKKDQNKTE